MSNLSPIPTSARRPTSWGIALLGAMVIAPTLSSLPTQAQTSGDASELGEWQTNERDTRSVGSTGLSPLELIQRIQSLSGQSPAEFESRQDGRLNDAAESFRLQQQQRLGNPTPETSPSVTGDR